MGGLLPSRKKPSNMGVDYPGAEIWITLDPFFKDGEHFMFDIFVFKLYKCRLPSNIIFKTRDGLVGLGQ